MEGFQEFKKNTYDLCIIDTNMPYRDGYTLAKEIRNKTTEIPIVFLLGNYIIEEVLQGYSSESDVFLNKPFDPKFLLENIKTLMQDKRTKTKREGPTNEHKIGEFTFDTQLRLLRFSGQEPVKLSPKESELLKMLLLYENKLMTREVALLKIWRYNDYYTSRSMDVYITKLRKYLKADESIEILNVPSKGFKLVTENIAT